MNPKAVGHGRRVASGADAGAETGSGDAARADDGVDEIGSLEELYAVLPERAYEPLWTMTGALTPEPVTRMVPRLWRYDETRALIMRAGELISAADAERRVLAFRNPGTAAHELARTTDTLWGAVQLVLPGEVAPVHRHTPAALRYIIEGHGANTTVDGYRVEMEPGDVVLTPNWAWHEHGHDGTGPVIWLDGLDLPMVHALHLVFADFGGAPQQAPPDSSPSLRSGELEARWPDGRSAQTLLFRLADAEAALEAVRADDGSPFDDLILEYRNPAVRGPVLPTMGACLQLLRPRVKTQPHRHTSSAVYHVVRGRGWSVISGERLEWAKGDTFALPTWAEHYHGNDSTDDALLFSFSDEPAVKQLGLLRERAGE